MRLLGFPTLFSTVSTFAICAAFLCLIHLLSKALKLRSERIVISNPRKEATLASVTVLAVFAATSLLECFKHTVYQPAMQLSRRPLFTLNYFDVLFTGFFYAVCFVPLWLAMRRSEQPPESIGVRKKNVWQMLALGLLLSGVYFAGAAFFAPDIGGAFAGFSPSLLYGLVVDAVVGSSEEVVWRGYIQTRFVAYSGTLKGLFVTSLLFALLHFPMRYYQHAGAVLEALASALLVLPAGLLFGYLMLRTNSVIPCAVFHLFGNWSALFWRIPPF